MISIISIILDLNNYKYINRNSLFLSLFTILSIIFIKRDNKYYIKLFLLGLLYDFIFTNYYLLHGFIFILFGLFISYYYKSINRSIINNIILGILIIFLYQFILFVILNITRINIMNLNKLLFITKHFIIINVIYIILISIFKKDRYW